jgi:hypothetical protein
MNINFLIVFRYNMNIVFFLVIIIVFGYYIIGSSSNSTMVIANHNFLQCCNPLNWYYIIGLSSKSPMVFVTSNFFQYCNSSMIILSWYLWWNINGNFWDKISTPILIWQWWLLHIKSSTTRNSLLSISKQHSFNGVQTLISISNFLMVNDFF